MIGQWGRTYVTANHTSRTNVAAATFLTKIRCHLPAYPAVENQSSAKTLVKSKKRAIKKPLHQERLKIVIRVYYLRYNSSRYFGSGHSLSSMVSSSLSAW